MKSWDFKIAGNPYVSAPGSQFGIQLGAALTEPAKPSEVGSVVIASFHGGVGRGLEQGIMRYKAAREINLAVPGEVLPGYTPQDAGTSFDGGEPVIMRPTMACFPGLSNMVFIITDVKIYTFDPTAPGSGISDALDEDGAGADFPDNAEYSGSVFVYNQQAIFGIIQTGAGGGVAGKPIGYGTVSFSALDTVKLYDTPGISYGANARSRAFWIENAGGSDTALRWAPSVAGASFKGGGSYTEQPTTGPGIELGFPRVTWMSMMGSSLIIMRSDGAIIGANESGILSVVGQIPMGTVDYGFGRRACLYHDGIMIPSQQGLWSFDLRSLTLRPASPNFVQGQIGDFMRGEISAVGASGPYCYFAQRQTGIAGQTVGTIGYVMVRYGNLIAVHDLTGRLSENQVITDVLPFYDSAYKATRLYYLVWDESAETVQLRYLPLRQPNEQIVDDSFISESAEVDLPPLTGQSPASNMTKLWTQIRGHIDKGSAGSDFKLQFSGFTVDNQTALTIPDVTVTGPFVVPLSGTLPSDLLGREMTTGTIKIVDGAHDTNLTLPLVLDFVWVPGTTDAITCKALVSGEVQGKVASLWDKGAYGQLQPLLDLRGTTTTLEFPESSTPWNVLVEGVQIDDLPDVPEGAGQMTRVATIQMRRLT